MVFGYGVREIPRLAMTPELIGIITVGAALAGLILGFVGPALRELGRDVGDLRERMARIEGLVEGLTGRGLQGVAADSGLPGED